MLIAGGRSGQSVNLALLEHYFMGGVVLDVLRGHPGEHSLRFPMYKMSCSRTPCALSVACQYGVAEPHMINSLQNCWIE
jgi:hypothetical protein